MKEPTIEEFNYELESDAILDIYSTAGEEEVNKDNFEVLTNKNVSILILAAGKGRSTIGDILSEMASSQALKLFDAYQFDKKSPTEIVEFLKEMFFTINNVIVEYLEVANISDCSTTLSIALIYKNTLFTAHIGESRIYVIHRDETATLLSKDPSYSKRISKDTLSDQEQSNYLGDPTLDEENFFVIHEANLLHKDTVFLCSNNMIETLSENHFTDNIEDIKTLLANTPPLKNASFLRYLHYERSVQVLRVEKEEIEENENIEYGYEYGIPEIDWEKFLPIIKKIALALGIVIIFIFFYQLLTNDSENKVFTEMDVNHTEETSIENNQSFSISPLEETTQVNEEVYIEETVKKEPELKPTTLKLLNKADSDVLYLGEEGIRITFKENQLIASTPELFYEKNKNSQILYCKLKAVGSELQGEIIKKLQKQYFTNSVIVKVREDEIQIRINIKKSCNYTRSNWAKKSGLDLLTFSCEE